jgi:hypothetical protein
MRLFALALASLVWLQAGADEFDDPWALLPSLPSACYTAEDDFTDRAYAAAETLATEIGRRDEVNRELSQQLSNLDPMEHQQRMMDYMMQNPQEAQKYMQAVTNAGTEVNEFILQMNDESTSLQQEHNNLDAEYDAAVKALDDAYANATPGLFQDSTKFDQDLARSHAAIDAYNGGYQKLCASYWKNGSYHDWLARHEDLQRRAAASENQSDVVVLNYTVFGIDAAGYRPVSSLSAAKRQIEAAVQVFNRRKYQPVPKEDFVPGP